MGSNLWSWQRAQPRVRPMKVRPTVSICSSTMSISIFFSSTSASTFGPSERKAGAPPRPGGGGAGRNQALSGRIDRVGPGEQVAGQLFEEEPVVRQVGVHRA